MFLFWAPQRDQIVSKALKSNDLGAFVFSLNIKNLHKLTRLKRQNRDTYFLTPISYSDILIINLKDLILQTEFEVSSAGRLKF